MSNDQLTDRAFWLRYWESKKNLIFPVNDSYFLTDILADLLRKRPVKTALEVGGFPGYYSVWLRKRGVKATLLDFVVHPRIFGQLMEANGLKPDDVGVIETDLFTYQGQDRYDLVFSNGLIEHFLNTEEIIARHVAMLADGGTLFVSLPNFRSLNGYFQRQFDPENYAKHNIDSMDPALLATIAKRLGLTNIEARYYGRFMLWLENESQQPAWVRWFRKTVWLAGKVTFKLLPIETKAFSPFILLTATKP